MDQLFAFKSHYGLWGVRGPHQEYQEEGKGPGKSEERNHAGGGRACFPHCLCSVSDSICVSELVAATFCVFARLIFVERGSIWARVSILLQIDKSDLLLKFSVSAALPKNWKLHARWNSIIAEYAYSAIESTTYVICSTFNRWPYSWAAYADQSMDKIKLWLLHSMIVWKCIHR